MNSLDANDESALIIAARSGSPELVRLLLCANADPDLESEEHGSPLSLAITLGRVEIAKELLKLPCGINIQTGNVVTKTPLIIAAEHVPHRDFFVRMLLDANANANFPGSSGLTPLMAAAEKGNVHVCSMLLGTKINFQSQKSKMFTI